LFIRGFASNAVFLQAEACLDNTKKAKPFPSEEVQNIFPKIDFPSLKNLESLSNKAYYRSLKISPTPIVGSRGSVFYSAMQRTE